MTDKVRETALKCKKCRHINIKTPQTPQAMAMVPYEFLSIVILIKGVSFWFANIAINQRNYNIFISMRYSVPTGMAKIVLSNLSSRPP